jgi:DNA-binding CsgD family transcriptional regulator
LDTVGESCLNIIETNLKNIISPFIHNLETKYLNLTPREIQVAHLIKQGKTTKEIAELLNASARSIEFHRNNLRNKLGVKNQKTSLKSYLTSQSE